MSMVRDMDNAELSEALARAAAEWDQMEERAKDNELGGGSPMESLHEWIMELDTEIERRRIAP